VRPGRADPVRGIGRGFLPALLLAVFSVAYLIPGTSLVSAASPGGTAPAAATEPAPAATPGPSPEPAATPGPTAAPAFPADLVAGPLPGSLVTPRAVSSARPWYASRPAGHGRILTVGLPAPWIGGDRSTATVDVYLPPGYDAGTGRYPVVYEAPQSIRTWETGIGFTGILDSLITSGAIPPMIFVFALAYGGPYADSECANAVDGHEWFDRFVSSTVVRWVDQHLRTITSSAARATLGFSQGGYCAAELVANHSGIFGSAMSFSGYFVAGIHSGTTPDAWRPFADNPAVENRISPMTVVPRIPSSRRSGLFFVMASDAAQGFYGPQMKQFAGVLDGAGVPMAIIPTALGHSWEAARTLVPTMLELVAGRMVSMGVFAPAR
jgi:S-formylglutathione hydrolase FrmB